MGLPKGRTNNPHGRKVGTKNVRTEQWEQLGEAICTRHSERANAILEGCDDAVFMDNFHKLLEYFKPKQARSEVLHKGDINTNITFRHE